MYFWDFYSKNVNNINVYALHMHYVIFPSDNSEAGGDAVPFECHTASK